jgi:rRNA maturation protein Nop10
MKETRETGGWLTVSALCPRCGVKQALAAAPARCVECGTLLSSILPPKKGASATQRPK